MIRAALILWVAFAQGAAGAQCRQALVLGLDVSGSVDSTEYRLQLDGLANALLHPEVIDAFLADPSAPVGLAIFEWSAPNHQLLIQPWLAVGSVADLQAVSGLLRGQTRMAAPPGTAVGTAMQTGTALLEQRRDCWKRTLDISGDGMHNMGAHPGVIKLMLEGSDVTINALVIGVNAPTTSGSRVIDTSELSAYFRAWVVTGPGSFVETAQGYADYEAAMVRKLKRELEVMAISALQ